MVGVNFTESVKYLYSLGNEVEAMKLGLKNIERLLTALGNPQNNFLKVQVAGTNGKGSVCAFLDAICISAGIETGLYTSPHLILITERVRINGRDISKEDFARHATLVRGATDRLLEAGELNSIPTFFEQVTAIALNVFAETNVELAILETGLGGRLDATTAANAEIAAITQIDYDHQEYLGNTLTEIAAEKAAIIHEGSRAVIGEQIPEAERVLLERCATFGIEPALASRLAVTVDGNTTGRECVLLSQVETRSLPLVFPPLTLGLLGRHQIENAKVSILLAEELQSRFPITTEHIIYGLENACHPGRLEYQGRFLFDGAHNIAGAKALREFLDEFEKRPITLVFGAMKGKPIAEIAEILFAKADKIILTQPDNSRAMTADELAGIASNHVDRDRCFLTQTVTEAIGKADEIADADSIILITGSLYLVGEAKRILNN